MGTTPEGHAAIREFYTYLLGTYLPTRYPTMFELVTTTTSPNGTPTTTFHNKATNHSTPLSPATPESDPLSMLHTLATTIEQDLFFLTLDPSTKTHRSTAFLCCHPSGFDPSQKGLGQSLGEIHGPVPSYDKIGPSMERFFSRLDVGRPVKRLNVCSPLNFPWGKENDVVNARMVISGESKRTQSSSRPAGTTFMLGRRLKRSLMCLTRTRGRE